MKILGKQILVTNLLIVFTVLVLSLASYFIIEDSSTKSIEELKTHLYDSYDLAIKEQVETIINALNSVINQQNAGLLTEEEAKIMAADIIRQAKYNGTIGYFWADDLEGNNIVLLGREDVEGTNRLGLTDDNGLKIVEELIKNAKAGGGYLDYYFPKPNETEASRKRGYSALFAPYNWVIGTGNYVDDIELVVATKEAAQKKLLDTSVMLLLVVAVVLLVIGGLVATFFSVTITKPIKKINELLLKTAELDLRETQELSFLGKRKDEIGTMAASTQHLIEAFREVLSQIHDFSSQLITHVQDMTQISDQTTVSITAVVSAVDEFAKGAQDQAEEANESVHSLESLNHHIVASNDLVTEVMDFSSDVSKAQEEGKNSIDTLVLEFEATLEVIKELAGNIEELSVHSSSINDIITTIEGIAGQTNLLALNASIEAARAGEAGKGFAVVASEIRNLAEQTTQSTSEINSIIHMVTRSVKNSKGNMEVSDMAIKEAFKRMVTVRDTILKGNTLNKESTNKITLVQHSFNTINTSKETALHAIQSISAVTEENAATAEEINATMETQKQTIQELDRLSKEISSHTKILSALVKKFTL